MASNSKGSLSNLIARARAAQEHEEETATEAPAVEKKPEPAPAAPPKAEKKPEATAPKAAPKSSRPKKTKKSGVGGKKSAPEIPELAPDRRQGRRGNPEYRQANAYIPRTLHMRVKRALLDEGDREFSSLVEELLEKWLESRDG